MDLFSLVARLTLDKTAYDKGISEAGNSAKSYGENASKAFDNLKKSAIAVGAAVSGAAAAIYKITTDAAASTDRIDKMSQKIGISRTAFQELDFVMSQSGTSVESLQVGMKSLRSAMESNEAGMNALGVSVRNTDGSLRSEEEVFFDTVTALQAMEDGAEKTALATKLFGRSGLELMPLLNGAAGSMDAMRQQAHDLGLVLEDDAIDAGVHFTDTLDQVKRSFGAVVTQIGVKVMPVIQNLLDTVLQNMPKIQSALSSIFSVLSTVVSAAVNAIASVAPHIENFVTWLTSGSASAEAFKAVIIALTAAFVAFKAAMAIQGLIQSVSQAFGVLNAVMNANPVMLIVSAIALLVTGLVTLYNKCEWFRNAVDSIFGWIKDAVEWIADKVKLVGEKISGLCQAIGGWFAEARNKVETAWSNIGDWFAEKRERINEKFANVREWFSEKFTNARNAVQTAWQNVGSWFQQRRNDIDNAFANMHTWFQQKGQAAWSLMKGAFTDPRGTFERIKGQVTGAFANVDTWLGQKFGQGWTNIKNAFGNVKKWFSDLWSNIKGLLKLPHFKISGSFSLNPISVPHLAVEWYRKAYENPFIFSEPTVFGNMGFGDGPGSEIVYGRQNLLEDIASAMRSVMGAGFTQNLTINSPTRLDPSEIARQTRNANREMVLALRGV